MHILQLPYLIEDPLIPRGRGGPSPPRFMNDESHAIGWGFALKFMMFKNPNENDNHADWRNDCSISIEFDWKRTRLGPEVRCPEPLCFSKNSISIEPILCRMYDSERSTILEQNLTENQGIISRRLSRISVCLKDRTQSNMNWFRVMVSSGERSWWPPAMQAYQSQPFDVGTRSLRWLIAW